jgi:putative endonuclease
VARPITPQAIANINWVPKAEEDRAHLCQRPRRVVGRTDWLVYLIRVPGGEIYTGITTDVDRRLGEHRAGRGAKYLRGRGLLTVVYRRKLGGRGLALTVENRIKSLTKSEKEAIVRTVPSRRRLLRTLRLTEEG